MSLCVCQRHNKGTVLSAWHVDVKSLVWVADTQNGQNGHLTFNTSF